MKPCPYCSNTPHNERKDCDVCDVCDGTGQIEYQFQADLAERLEQMEENSRVVRAEFDTAEKARQFLVEIGVVPI